MEKNLAAVENQLSSSHQRPKPEPAPNRASAVRKEKTKGEHNLNLFISYELKCRLQALAEKYELSASDIVRQVLKAGLPVFESLSTAQEELISGYIDLLRKNRSMAELKKSQG